MTYYTRFSSALCDIVLVGDERGLSQLHLSTNQGAKQLKIDPAWQPNNPFFERAINQLQHYFAGQRHHFTLKLNPQGTPFQRRVWRELSTIGYGELLTYKEIANAIDNPKACRAVGMANSKNPLPIVIPCHRVVGANGQLTGFASGLAIKEKLIGLEQSHKATLVTGEAPHL